MSLTMFDNYRDNAQQSARHTVFRAEWLLATILIGALVLRMGLVVFTHPDPGDDTSTYLNLARYMVEGKGYTQNGTDPTRVRTPTYPVFLASIRVIFGENPRAILFVQAILGTLTVWFVYLLSRHLFGLRVALVATAITACYPALIYYDARILRESLTTFLVMALMLSVLKTPAGMRTSKQLLGSGALIAVASMCRPELLLLFFPVIYILHEKPFALRRTIKTALTVALPVLLVWGPWTLRNIIVFGNPSPVAIGITSTIWFGSRWAAIDGDDHKPEDRVQLQQKNMALSKGADETNWEKNYRREVWRDLANRPGWMLQMVGNKAILFWKDANGVKKTLPAIHPALPVFLNTYYYSLLLFASAAIALGIRKNPKIKALAIFVLTYMAIYALLHVRNRYRVPVLPVVFILSASGAWSIIHLIREKFVAASTTQK